MNRLYSEGSRVLLFYGGEPFLWRDGVKRLPDLLSAAKTQGFICGLVTNGTIHAYDPLADFVLLSIDGLRETHDIIRGCSFDSIMNNLDCDDAKNVTAYMAVNQLNFREIRPLTTTIATNPRFSSISFNFHTPYAGTEYLTLADDQKKWAVSEILRLKREGYPVLNLPVALNKYLSGEWDRPCPYNVVIDQRQRYLCGRCSEAEKLCQQCGYMFAIEFSLLFNLQPRAIMEALTTYPRLT